MAQPAEFDQVTNNATEGAQIGRTSTELLAFYGATPVARPVTVSTSAVSTTTSFSMSTVGQATVVWSFKNSVDLRNILTAVSTMQHAMKQLGLVA